ncbi:MAG: hypothetical protein LBN24_09540 [Mediterranea sp.]|nr:hypothetical protein [Mediterranea sp.]
MKQIAKIFILLACALSIVSCGDDAPVGAGLKILGRDVNITAVGGKMTVNLSVPADKVTSNEDWCVVAISGAVVTVTVEENLAIEGRTAYVTVSRGIEEVSFPVTQKGNIVPMPEQKSITFGADGGIREVAVKHGTSFTASVEAGASWLTATIEGDMLKLSAVPNNTSGQLKAIVVIASGALSAEITVTQTGIVLIPDQTTLKLLNEDTDSYEIAVNSTKPFTAVSNEGWLTVVANANSVTLTATDNGTDPSRTAIVTLTSGELTATITVTQALPAYADFLGKWTLTGDDNGTPFSYNLSIVQDVEGTSYKVTGWGKSIVATDSQYAITVNYDKSSGLISIASQSGLGTYTDGEEFTVAYHGNIGEEGSYVSGDYICYIGRLRKDGSVAWGNGSVTLSGGDSYSVVGANYYLIRANGTAASFTVDSSPFMRQPVMTKVSANTRTPTAMTRSSVNTLKVKADRVKVAK